MKQCGVLDVEKQRRFEGGRVTRTAGGLTDFRTVADALKRLSLDASIDGKMSFLRSDVRPKTRGRYWSMTDASESLLSLTSLECELV